jgi:hypothetical protein
MENQRQISGATPGPLDGEAPRIFSQIRSIGGAPADSGGCRQKLSKHLELLPELLEFPAHPARR